MVGGGGGGGERFQTVSINTRLESRYTGLYNIVYNAYTVKSPYGSAAVKLIGQRFAERVVVVCSRATYRPRLTVAQRMQIGSINRPYPRVTRDRHLFARTTPRSCTLSHCGETVPARVLLSLGGVFCVGRCRHR